ncbi:hypothetical protein EYF88_02005 [Paracoccus sediminis]|uniref:Uncharacterized protein n=1 Tax=Paracoccus sediminis TaxID=1214787 RepID=A0A238UNV4_9RHOB|nr:hypothetical protein [Paracoccus sediminis]TBN52997.1 hypothetical protein EYF88_02005 [Paracoccus sediminis]SNR23765.1 hypothetical protein SAMN06265378_101222 [Paracoccus sediminis]
MRRFLGGCVFWLVLASISHAGPWPRDPGHSFLALSGEFDGAGNAYTGFYAEYGLARRRTLGLEISTTNVGETGVMLWYQKSLDGGEGPNKLSYSMGFGVIRQDGNLLPQSQFALMWGRGFSGIWDGGWLTAEARVKVAGKSEKVWVREGLSSVEYAYLTPDAVAKLDLTLGVRPIPLLALVNQLRLESQKDAEFSAKLASSAIYDLGGPARLEVGVIAPLIGPSEAALKIGTWLEF